MIATIAILMFMSLVLIGPFRTPWAIAMLFVFFALKLVLQSSVSPFRSFPPLANFFLAGVIGGGFALAMIRQTRPFAGSFTPALGIILLLYVWSITSLAWSPAVPDAHNHGSNIMRDEWPYVVLVVLVAPFLVDGIGDWDISRQIILFGGSLITLLVIFNPEFTIKYGRIGIALDGVNRSSPLAIGQMGGTLAIIGALYRGRIAGRGSVILGLAGFLLGCLLALYSGSRGQAIFALLALLIAFPMSRRLKSIGTFIGSSLALTLAITMPYIAFSMVTGGADVDRWRSDRVADASGIRTQNILILLRAFIPNPLAWVIGLGFNAFSGIDNDLGQGYSHCTFIDVLCEEGLIMFTGLLILCGMVIRASRNLFKKFQNLPAQRSAVATLIGLWIYQVFLCNKEGNLWASVNFFMVSLLVVRIGRREMLELPREQFDTASESPAIESAEHSEGLPASAPASR